MKTPFTTEQFFLVFEQYNSGVFPAQIIFLLLGIAALYAVLKAQPEKHRITGTVLGICWIWMGLVYHIMFFSSINPPAYMFGGLFIVQGVFFFTETFRRNKLEFGFSGGTMDSLAIMFILFGLVLYPLVSYFMEGSIPKTISFGLPCPTTIATFGFLMLAKKNFPKYLLIIPSLWAIIGTTAAVNFGVFQDFMLIITAIVADIYLLYNQKKKAKVVHSGN